MKSISPSSPLLTLVVEPKEGTTAQNLLSQFHPIMKSLDYGHFGKEQDGFFQASKGGDGFFSSELFVFAEVQTNSVVINIDGHSIFGLKGVEQQLHKIKEEYESFGATAKILGPDYANALIGNLLYTALPIYASACLVVGMMYALDTLRISNVFSVFLYASIGVLGAKTRFWVNERRKQRPIWKSILIMLLTAPLLLGIVILVFWAIEKYA
ncbi:MAG: hypothetical protein K9G41_12395 [Flavobacteriales bacterium]|nr:hypothetical protein [Flavobacteriales bacterium]